MPRQTLNPMIASAIKALQNFETPQIKIEKVKEEKTLIRDTHLWQFFHSQKSYARKGYVRVNLLRGHYVVSYYVKPVGDIVIINGGVYFLTQEAAVIFSRPIITILTVMQDTFTGKPPGDKSYVPPKKVEEISWLPSHDIRTYFFPFNSCFPHNFFNPLEGTLFIRPEYVFSLAGLARVQSSNMGVQKEKRDMGKALFMVVVLIAVGAIYYLWMSGLLKV